MPTVPCWKIGLVLLVLLEPLLANGKAVAFRLSVFWLQARKFP